MFGAAQVADENMAQNEPSDAPIVCLDPGHPSEVNDGMTVQNGVTENHINWLIAQELRDLLEADGIRVVMTKSSEDELVTNEERARIANESGAVLFFRIHCDNGPSGAHGMTFYYPDRQGIWDGHTGPSTDLLPECHDAACAIHDPAIDELDGLLHDRGVRTDNETYLGSRQGGALRGSILSEIPVVLVEVCFLSDPDDASVVKDASTRSLVVQALSSGIQEYVETK